MLNGSISRGIFVNSHFSFVFLMKKTSNVNNLVEIIKETFDYFM